MIARADKGKTIIIINTDEYTKKVESFLTENDFHTLQNNPTNKDQKLLHKILQQCNLLIDKKQIKFLMQKNPLPPTLKAQIKLHKPGHPIRPVINNIKAPSYKIAKHLTNILNRHLHLENQYNVKDSITLAENLTKITINENHKIVTYDIKDLYVNIPIQETLKITESLLNKENNTQITKQIITLLEATLKQNYFEFQNNIYQPKKGVAMGSPISGKMAEIFLQHIENLHIKHLLDTKSILYYTRYVDDILIIYDTRHSNDNTIQKYINQLHKNIQLTPTHEEQGQTHFLDLTIIRNNTKLEIDVYRKPTTTNTTINYNSNHPTEHKTAAYRHYIKRMQALPLTTERQKTEWETIKTIAKSNNFPDKIITQLKSRTQQKTHKTRDSETNTNKNKKWAVFTYHRPKIRKTKKQRRYTGRH
jgi:hypothetical protein